MSSPLSETVAIIIFNGSEAKLDTFEAMRNEFDETWGDLLVADGHFWGRGVERPNRFFWVAFFKSDSAFTQYLQHPNRNAFRARIVEMASDLITFFGLHTRSRMRELLRSPVVEVSHFRIKPSFTVADSDAQCHIVSNAATVDRKTEGLHGYDWALTEERGGEGVFIGGWDSVEAREASIDYEDQEMVEQIEKAFSMAESLAMMNVVFQPHAPPR